MTLRRPRWFEIAVQVPLALVFLMFGGDLVEAIGAAPCSLAPEDSGCYPWGETEGPAASIWAYGSKARYIGTSVALLAVLAAAIAAPFLARRTADGLGAMLLIAIGGWLAVRNVPAAFFG